MISNIASDFMACAIAEDSCPTSMADAMESEAAKQRVLDEIERLRATLDAIARWHIVGPLTSEQGCQLMRITHIAKDALSGFPLEKSLRRTGHEP